MRVLILGATGASGVKLIEESLAASHTIVVFARSPQKLPEHLANNPNVIIHKGELTDEVALANAMEGVEAILSALGPTGPFHPSGTPLAHAYSKILQMMKDRGIRRLIALGTPSIPDPEDKFSPSIYAMVITVSTFARTAYKEFVAIGNVMRTEGDGVDWTIARVPILTNAAEKKVAAGYVGDGKTSSYLTRAGFGAFVVEELDRNDWVKKFPFISLP